MTTMLEKMIASAGTAMFEPKHYAIHPIDTPESWSAAERVVLSVLSDLRSSCPDAVEKAVGRAAWHSGSGQRPANIIAAMIDAILNEKPETTP